MQDKAHLNAIIALWGSLRKSRKKHFFSLIFLMMIASIAEMASIGSILPFLGALTAPDAFFSHSLMTPVKVIFSINKPSELLLPLTIIFITTASIAGFIRVLLLRLTINFSYFVGAEISVDMYKNVLSKPYSFHISHNSSEIINSIINKTSSTIHEVLVPILTLLSSFVILFGILFILIAIDPFIAITTFSGFAIIYFVIIYSIRKRLNDNSNVIAIESSNTIKFLQEGLGGIRDIIIDNSQDYYCKNYRKSDLKLRSAQSSNNFLALSPRYMVETLGMIFISAIAYFLSKGAGGISMVIPTLGVLVLGVQRMLPVLQQCYGSWSHIKGSKKSLLDVIEFLNDSDSSFNKLKKVDSINFKNQMSVNNLWFKHETTDKYILKNISFKINKGDSIGIIGKTGSGKSTLVDIIMFLLKPSKGNVTIDGKVMNSANVRAWQDKISHVPQNIFLSDASVLENIAFGVDANMIDVDRAKKAASMAQLKELIDSWPDKYNTKVGERGAKISGGQRQRIGIARALYKNPEVIILDEATSALDGDTEKKIINMLHSMPESPTVIMIAHRVTTLKTCNSIFELSNENGVVLRQYDSLLENE
jgi:ATP-binding cassette, subfamily B, bacterial PglK